MKRHWSILGILWKCFELGGLCFDGLSKSRAESFLVGDQGERRPVTNIAVRQRWWGVNWAGFLLISTEHGAGREEVLGATVDGRGYIQQGHEVDTPLESERYLPGRFQYLGCKIRMTDVQHLVQTES